MLDFSVTFVITIINIAFLCFILRLILFKPVTKFMAERAKRVQADIEQANQEKASAQKMLAEYQGKLENANAEAQGIILAARKEARAEADRIIEKGRAEVDAMTFGARRRIEEEQQAAIARFGLEAAALVMAASSRLVQRDFSGDDNRRYAAMLLDELAAQKGKP